MTSHTDHHDAGHGPSAGYEKTDVAVGKVVLVTFAAIVIIGLTALAMELMFVTEKEDQFQKVVFAPESTVLRDLRAREDAELHSYEVVDTANGRYRIPIERAMQLMADEAYLKRMATDSVR